MDPEKVIPVPVLFQPVKRVIGRDLGAALREDPGQLAFRAAGGHLVVINVESLLESKVAPHGPRAHKGSSKEARLFRHSGQRQVSRIEHETTHVSQAVNFRVGSREHTGVGRKRERHLGGGMREACAARCQRVQVGRLGGSAPVLERRCRPRRTGGRGRGYRC